MRPTPVICPSCKWRGRRLPGECACYDEWAMYCACTWGYCPKCSGRVVTLDFMRLCTNTPKEFATPEKPTP